MGKGKERLNNALAGLLQKASEAASKIVELTSKVTTLSSEVDELSSEVDELNDYDAVTLSRNTVNVPPSSGATCRFYKHLGICFCRIGISSRENKVFEPGELYTIYTIPEKYRPSSSCAAVAYVGSSRSVESRVGSDGAIVIVPKEQITTSWLIYVQAWWFTSGGYRKLINNLFSFAERRYCCGR